MAHTEESRRRAYEKMKKRRKDWFDTNGPCVECGSSESLELDHIDPSLKVDNRIWSWSEARMFEELAKCQVLCRACHLKKTLAERLERQPPKHGTVNMYRRHKCRCEPCLEAKRVQKRIDYRRKKAKR